jgi:hypothetical protein
MSRLLQPSRARPAGRLILLGLQVLCGIWFAIGGAGWPAEEEPAPPAAVGVPDRERALQLLGRARQACGDVRDYRCTLTTRERLRGRLQPEQVMAMEVRVRPFAVRLRWQQPGTSAGQQVCYAVGANEGRMRVRPAGYLGAVVGVMSLDPHAPSVRENSRHAITSAGFASMLEEFAATWEGKVAEVAAVRVANSAVNGTECFQIEVVLSDVGSEWQRAALHIEQESGLPVRVEYHDAEGRVLDEATYRNLELNVGLEDEIFTR